MTPPRTITIDGVEYQLVPVVAEETLSLAIRDSDGDELRVEPAEPISSGAAYIDTDSTGCTLSPANARKVADLLNRLADRQEAGAQ